MGRPGPYGNDWSHKKYSRAKYIVATPREAIQKYSEWFHAPEQEKFRKKVLRECMGKTLGCWCRNKNQCHVGIIIDYINENTPKNFGTLTKFFSGIIPADSDSNSNL